MTIKELENRTGMTRANIRFYEGEGLLSPKRLENGYRDYSEEDARTLEKIKLLRQLQLDIDTIRRVQGGALTLEQALFTQLTRLEGDKALIERAAEVCRELQRSSVEYAALEPQPWLWKLEAPQRQELPEPPADLVTEAEWDGEIRAYHCPWQRYFARVLDLTLCRTLVDGVTLALFHRVVRPTGLLVSFLWGLVLLALTLALEPLWLHFVGWTPGKWLFGLKLRDEDGEKLSIAQGWQRSWRVLQDGYGWTIPFWNWWKMWKCRELSLMGRDCWWDGEEGYRYTKVERRFSVGVVYVLLVLTLFGVRTAAGKWSALPRNMGGLTVTEFSQNYNQFHDSFSELGFSHIPKLDYEGRWAEDDDGGRTVTHGSGTSITQDGTTYTIENPIEGTTVWSQPEFTLEDGQITAVTLRWESRDSIVSEGKLRAQLVLMALSGAAEGLTLFNFDPVEWYFALWELSPFEDQELDFWGLHVSQRVEYEGYASMGSTLWTVDEDAPYHCEWSMTISVPE